MIARRSLTTVAATALLLGGAGTAWAGDSHDLLPGADTALVQVFVNSEADVDRLSATYDLAEYKQVEDDGTIQLNIDADPSERAELRAMGFRIGKTIEDAGTRAAVNAEREDMAAREGLAKDLAKNGVPRGGIKLEGKAIVPTPGETVIQRANKFTNYAGTFIYVEAHNKATTRVAGSNTAFTGPTLALSLAGADGVFGAATNMGRFIDTDVTPDEYMYHRQLVRLTPEQAAIPAAQIAWSAWPPAAAPSTRSRSRSGSASSCRRTSPATRRASSTATRTRPRTVPSSTRWPRSSRTWSPRSTCRT